jgi:hypothetical protein
MAETIANIIARGGPIPMMFTHQLMPSFRDTAELSLALDHVSRMYDIDWSEKYMQPTWTHDNWGTYARLNQWNGFSHFFVPVLTAIEDLYGNDGDTDDEIRWEAHKFFRSIRYEEQPFGMSWLQRVSYTLPADGDPNEDILNLPGIHIIDLDSVSENETEEVEHETS